MSTHTGTGVSTAKGGQSWSSYWKQRSLFYAEVKNVSDGKLYNEVSGATDYLTVVGTAGNYTFQCPDTANYIAADADKLWFTGTPTRNTVLEADLVDFDFARTLVFYQDVAPYSLIAIAILKPDISVTDTMRKSFHLSIWWDNTLSFYGNVKGNRGIGKSVWNPDYVFSAEYLTVLAAMTTAPKMKDKIIQNTMIAALVAGGYYAKAEFLDIFATHSQDTSLLNWKNPSAFIPTAVGSPAWIKYKSYTGASGKYLRLHYTPSVDKIGIAQDNSCYIVGCQTAPINTSLFGGMRSDYQGEVGITTNGTASHNYRSYYLNSSANGSWVPFTDTKGHYGMSRIDGSTLHLAYNQTSTTKTAASNRLCEVELFACGLNYNGSNQTSLAELSYVLCFTHLTVTEQEEVIAIMEAYLDNYGYGIY